MTNEKIETIEEDFAEKKLSESEKMKSEKLKLKLQTLKVDETLKNNHAQFFAGYSLEELEKTPYIGGSEFDINNATLSLLGNGNGARIYYMVVSDLSKLSSDIQYFRNKVIDHQGALIPAFDKVQLNFLSEKEDFRSIPDIVESIEIV